MKRLLLVLIIICLLMFGCSMNKQEEPPEQKGKPPQIELKEDKSPTPDLPHYTQQSIKAYLAELENIFWETWSHDQRKVAYIVFDPPMETTKMFIWQVAEKEPQAVQGIEGRIDELYWSPNSKYIIADSGTSPLRLGEIVDAEARAKIDSINYVGKPVWSPDGKWLALGHVRRIEPPIEWELDGTVDLMLYNVESKEAKVIKQGNHQEHFRPLTWYKDGVLEYASINFDGDSNEQWYLPDEGMLESYSEQQTIQQYASPSEKNEIILVNNNRGFNVYWQNEKTFTLIKQFSYLADFQTISWSPGERYMFLGTGGSEISAGYVFDLNNGKKIASVDYLSGPFWSPSGDHLSFTRPGREKPGYEGHSFSSDVYIYDVENRTSSCVLKGTSDFYYTVEGWDQEGVVYAKRDNVTGEVLEKGRYRYSRNIFSWNPDTGRMEVLETFFGTKYAGFNYSPDRKWIAIVKHLPGLADASPKVLVIYNTETKEIKEPDMVFQEWPYRVEPSWFNLSPKIIINGQKLLDLNSWETMKFKVAENEKILSAEPAPDDGKLAVFTYYHDENTTEVMGLPFNLNIMDNNGQEVLNKYETDLLPFFNNNSGSLFPVSFSWLGNSALVVENWREQYKEISDVYKIDLNSGETQKLAENAHTPIAAPNGTRIAVVEMNGDSVHYPQSIKIIDPNGNTITTLNCKDLGLDFFGADMMWSTDSSKLVVKGYKEENERRNLYAAVFDVETNNSKVLQFSDNELVNNHIDFLYVSDNGQEIIFSRMGSLEKYSK